MASRVNLSRRLAYNALALSLAMLLSWLELLLPLPLLLPGLKLGLANLAVMYVFFAVGHADAAAVSLLRVLLMSLLFGSASSFLFSLGGATLSYLALLALSRGGRYISRLGISMGASASHILGQMLAACLLYGMHGPLALLPFLLLGSVPLGLLNGAFLLVLERKLPPPVSKEN